MMKRNPQAQCPDPSRSWLLTRAAVAVLLCTFCGRLAAAEPLPIETTLVDANAIHSGTFQSHNQKVVANSRGIFMTHVRSRNEAYTAQQWHDHAVSEPFREPSAIGGCREVTPNGWIIGSFTDVTDAKMDGAFESRVHFFRIKLRPTSNEFQPGHRTDQNADAELEIAEQTTHRGGARPSQLILPVITTQEPRRQFRLWAIGDAHVGTDIKRKRESLADAIRQSEQGGQDGAPAFDWDIAINVGDFSGNQGPPDDDEGREVMRQYAVSTKHRREDFYDLAGNHDASENQWWFRKWIDPAGENTKFSGVDPKRRRYPVTGTWERYEFRVGNLLFLVMSDRNDLPLPVGRGKRGGYPPGAVTSETVAWWKQRVEANCDAIIISAHHHMLRETTVGSGDFEGGALNPDGSYTSRYHGYQQDGGSPEGSSYLYYVDDKPKATAFENYLAAHPGAIDLWIGGHTHTNPDDNFNGRTHLERKWDASFINCCALTRFHVASRSCPMSRLLTFTEGSTEVRVQCYLHTNTHAPQGWYPKAERLIMLAKPFRMD